MARPRKAAHVRRAELRLAEDDPLLIELAQEAQLRGVELTQHIHDLLRGRYLIRRGQSLADLLWVPGATAEPSSATSLPAPNTAPSPAAGLAGVAWADLLDVEES